MAEANGEQGQAKSFTERFGFESDDKAAEAYEAMKRDLGELKGKARAATELEKRLAEYEAAEAKRKDAEMTETQKLAERLAAMEKQVTERDALIAAKDRAILTERVFSSKLNGKTPEESAVLRRLLSSAVAGQTFADEVELAELLKPVEAEYDTLRAKFSAGVCTGPGIAVGGGHGLNPATGSPAAQDFAKLSLVDQIKAGQRLTKG